MAGIFSLYERGLEELLKRLDRGCPRYIEALTLQARLLENISDAHEYGDSENLRSERNRLLAQSNRLALETLEVSFNELVELEDITLPQDSRLPDPFEDVTPTMVAIPAGRFAMGSSYHDRLSSDNERPQHSSITDSYFISRYPITNSQYRAFVEATGYQTSEIWSDKASALYLPVTSVSWYDCWKYCQWLGQITGQSFRLPTEAEWEKAARGADGYLWPWGNEFDGTRCNTAGDLSEAGLTEVGRFAPLGDSSYGISDMAGNAWEWTSSLLMPYPYQRDERENTDTQGKRVLRGGSWRSGAKSARCSHRGSEMPSLQRDDIGFRVACS